MLFQFVFDVNRDYEKTKEFYILICKPYFGVIVLKTRMSVIRLVEKDIN